MTQIIDAVYERGVFRPLGAPSPPLTEGQQVRIVVEADESENDLELAAQVYDGLAERDIEDVERIALDRSRFFMRVPRS